MRKAVSIPIHELVDNDSILREYVMLRDVIVELYYPSKPIEAFGPPVNKPANIAFQMRFSIAKARHDRHIQVMFM